MAEAKDPKGELSVDVELRLFDPASDLYRKLNHGLVPRRVNVLSIECTQAEGQQLVERIRDENPANSFPATWLGRTEV